MMCLILKKNLKYVLKKMIRNKLFEDEFEDLYIYLFRIQDFIFILMSESLY